MKHDTKMLICVIAKVLTTQTTVSKPLLNRGDEGHHLSTMLYFSWTVQPEPSWLCVLQRFGDSQSLRCSQNSGGMRS